MAEIYIHIPGGEQLLIVPEASSSQDWALMGDNKLSLSFQRYECLNLPAGAWCEFDGVIFYLLQEYKPTMIHSHLWQYNVAFVDGASWLGVTTALKTIDGEDAPLFTLTAPAIEHATIIVSNLNRRLGTTMWKVGSVIDTPNIPIEYAGKYCGAVLQEIVDDQNTEWWVDGTTLNIGRAEFGSLIELGYRDGLLGDITVTHADNMSSYRTLYPVGSTRNILPTEYGHDRLQLPNGQRSVMMNPAGVAELVEEAAFADIYPRYKGKVTDVSTSIGQSNDGSQYLIYYIADAAIPFNPNEYEMPGLVKHITFQSGELMGAEFEVNYNPASNEFELITQFQENGSQLPGGMLIPQVGDEYVVWNISMPAEYYPLAEQELLEAAESFAAASTRESNVYKVKLDYIDVQERGLSLRPGQKVRLHSVDYFPKQGYYDSRITRVTRPVNYPGEYTIDVSAVRVVGSLTRLQTSLAAATTKVNNLSNAVQTVVQTVSNAVTLTGNQRVKGVKDFVDGVKIGGLPLYPIDENTVFLDANIVFGGAATMFGKDSTTFPPIWANIPFDDTMRWDGSKWSVFGGTGSGGGTADSVAWNNITDKPSWIGSTKPRYSYDEITGKPTTLSAFTNDSGFITASSSITGNAATATKLATTRSIWGQSFDGSTDISGNIFPINTSGCYYNENGISYHTNKQYQASILRVTSSYNVAIGGTTASEKLEVHGNVKATSFIGSLSGNAATSNRLIEEVVTDLNNATPGRIFTMTSGYGSTDGNKPTTGWVTGLTLQFAQNGVYRRQLAYSDVDLYIREEHNGVWEKWRKILTSTNFYDYALPKDGTASASWKLANVRYLWGQLFDGTSNIGGQMSFNAGDFILAHNATDAWTDGNGLTHPWYGIDFRAGGSYKGYISHWSGISLVSGNDITLASDKNVVVSNGKLRINQSAFSNGLTLNRTSANAGAGIVFQSNGSLLGQIGINGTKTFEVSDGTTIKASIEIPTGNLILSGVISMNQSSDERLKKNIRKVNASEVLMSLGGVWQYEYIDSEVQKNSVYDGTHFGLIYQNVKGKSLDKMCHKREDGMGALNYVDADFISIIAGATMENISEVEKLKRKIRTLENKVKQLEQVA